MSGAGGAGQAGGRKGADGGARPPRPPWLPDDPVGRDRHLAQSGRPGRAWPSRDDEPTGFASDTPWRVTEGVTPVIAPGVDDDRHDPGPNVIGRRG